MTRILILNGPNLSTLGEREPEIYGSDRLVQIEERLRTQAESLGVELRLEQTNHEGRLIDLLEEERERSAGCVINPGGLSHTSVALADAIRAFPGPVVEVHLSNIHARERFRRVSLTAEAATAIISGLGADGYRVALEALVRMLEERRDR